MQVARTAWSSRSSGNSSSMVIRSATQSPHGWHSSITKKRS